MFFLYKVSTVSRGKSKGRIKVELFDFVLGKVDKFFFDGGKYLEVEAQLRVRLKDVSFDYGLKRIP